MEFNLATYFKVSAFFVVFALGCASTQPKVAEIDQANRRSFAHWLRLGDLEKAGRFALYFKGNSEITEEGLLLAQYALQTCQPQLALQQIQQLPQQPQTERAKAVVLALLSQDRPWTKPILDAREIVSIGIKEELRKEVWRDEWERAEFHTPECKAFPVYRNFADREAAKRESLVLFEKNTSFSDLPTLGLALDVGYRPSPSEIRDYLNRFAKDRANPYYARLQHWSSESAESAEPLVVSSQKTKGRRIFLSPLTLTATELTTHTITLPWIAGTIQ